MARRSTSARIVAGLFTATSFATIAHAADISGNVSDSGNIRPLQAATIRLVELDRVAITDREGGYIFADVPEGTYTINATYVGAQPSTVKVQVPATGRTMQDFALAGIGAASAASAASGGEILVIGQAANQSSALSRQKAADGVSSVLTRDAIGQFPDQNVAESLRRLPGVNILNDQGEGRFVSIRGLDPELNATSINGVRLPAPESDVRSVALDVISSDIIESVVVKKSLTPDMDADTIGGSIEINTTSAFDRKKSYVAARAEGSYNAYSGKVTPKGSVDFSTRIGQNVGIAGGLSYYKREFETDNVETGGHWSTADNGVVYNEEVQYRDYDVTRKRLNASLSLDLRASETTTLYARGNWSQFDDHEYRRRTTFIFDGEPHAGSDEGASFSDSDDRIEIRRDLKDRFERQRIRSIVVGGDTDTGTWKFNWSGSYAKSTERENGSIDPMRFRARFADKGVDIDWDYSNPRVPQYEVTAGADLVNDPANYGFNRIELTDLSDSRDEEYALKGDVARTFATAAGAITVQAGAKGRWREKSYDFNLIYYGDFDGDFTLADVLGKQTYRLADIGPVISKGGPAAFYRANLGQFEVDDYESALGSATSDYAVKENIAAGYLLGRWDSDTLRVIGGLRMERTRNVLSGSLVTDAEPDVLIDPVRYTRTYTDWLPSLTVRFSPDNRLVARAAVYKSLVRPKLSNLAPRYTINEDDEAEFGNPDLKPYRAWNADAGVEYYFASNGAVSLGGFYKSISNYVVTGFFEADDAPFFGEYRGTTFSEATIPVNGRSAKVYGLEASYSQAFTMLPAPFDGLLTQVNYTYTHSRGELFDGRKIPLPASARNTFNVVVGYEKGPLDLRLAGTYRDKYLDEIGSSADEDRIVDDHFQLDASAKFKLTENVRLIAEVVNINNAKYFAYEKYAGRPRLLQYEEYGRTYKFGARVTF